MRRAFAILVLSFAGVGFALFLVQLAIMLVELGCTDVCSLIIAAVAASLILWAVNEVFVAKERKS